MIAPDTALERLRDYDVDHITRARLDADPGAVPIGGATPASTGVSTGQIALDPDTAVRRAAHEGSIILVREDTSTDDVAALAVCRGLLTSRGARTSHAAVVARQLGIVALVNCPGLSIDLSNRTLCIGDTQLGEGDVITLDGTDGHIYTGTLRLVEDRPRELIARVHAWQHGAPA
jgi:pyruvate,orthophosphate dikinase